MIWGSRRSGVHNKKARANARVFFLENNLRPALIANEIGDDRDADILTLIRLICPPEKREDEDASTAKGDPQR